MKKPSSLFIGSTTSLGFLAIFIVFHSCGYSFLDLPVQWIAVSVIPLIVSLFLGGYINSFKGFGIEIENTLKKPVTTIDLKAQDVVAKIEVKEKADLGELQKPGKRTTEWLRFRSGKQGFYNVNVIQQYLMELHNLRFLEVMTINGDFICFIPAIEFKKADSNINFNNVVKLKDAIENENVPEAFRDSAITLKVKDNQSIIEVLKKMREEKSELAAVVSPDGKYLGVIMERDIEKKIADTVLIAEQRL